MGAGKSKLEKHFEETTTYQMKPIVYRGIPQILERWPMPNNPMAGADMTQVLTIFSLNLNLAENAQKHSTTKYATLKEGVLVVRRGHPFRISLVANRNYQQETDVMSFVFYLKGVEKPSPASNSMIFLPVVPTAQETAPHNWTAHIVGTGGGEGSRPYRSANGTNITVEITSSPESAFGEWYLQIDTNLRNNKNLALNFKHNKPIVFLFNAWNPKDPVYIQDESLRQEYVLKDEGIIFIGTHRKIDKTPWTYGQFSPGVIECCSLMVRSGNLAVLDRNNPVLISRLVSALANAQDDNGLLVGRWDGNYSDAISPNAWIGSAKIIQKYIETGVPVRYGQCWVYGGVITTLARAMGIPTRTVTCFNAGHDSNATLTIDVFINQRAETIKNMSEDMTWNYHVWNELWMTRPDLDAGSSEQIYGGWQTIDATPQEESDGIFRVGPCSVAAVKKGDVTRPYDVPYVLGEVNADYVKWLYRDEARPVKALNWEMNYIGRIIATQKTGTYDTEDITANYKEKENTKEERNIMSWAWNRLGDIFPRFEKNNENPQIKFKLDPKREVQLGENLSIRIRTMNNSKLNPVNVKIFLTLEAVTYTNKRLGIVKQEEYNRVVGKNVDYIEMLVPYTEYAALDKEQGYLQANMLASIPQFDLDYYLKQSFRITAPDLKISTDGPRQKGTPMNVTVQIKNTLPRPISKSYMILHGSGVGEGQKHIFREGAKPSEVLSHTFTVIPQKSGEIFLNAKFWSPELHYAEGFSVVSIK